MDTKTTKSLDMHATTAETLLATNIASKNIAQTKMKVQDVEIAEKAVSSDWVQSVSQLYLQMS